MRPRAAQWILAAGVLAAGLAAIAIWRSQRARPLDDVARRAPPPTRIVDADARSEFAPADDAARPSALADAPTRAPASTFARVPLSPATVGQLVQLSGVGSVFDGWSGHRQRSWVRHDVEWKEHPRGTWTQRTDAFGLRRDREPSARAPDLRVLVTGDSHTDGVLDNADSYCALLETDLAQRAPGTRVEVLNAARSGSTFHNYLGVLERWLALEPDVYVVTVYGGNDFSEALTWQRLVNGVEAPEAGAREREAMERALVDYGPAVAQAFVTFSSLSRDASYREFALQAARDVTTEIQATCARFGVRLVVAYLPPACDVEWAQHASHLDAVRAMMELTDDELRCIDRLADRYLAFLRERSIEVVDLRAPLRAAAVGSPTSLYWHGDFHLNLAGHRVVADALREALGASAPPPRARRAPEARRPALPQWGTSLAPGAPGPREWARWSRASARAARDDAPPQWTPKSFAADAIELGPHDVRDPRCGRTYRSAIDAERDGSRLRTDSTGARIASDADVDAPARVLVVGDDEVDAPRADERRLPAAIARAWRRERPSAAIHVRDAARAGFEFDAYAAAVDVHGARAGETVVLVVDGDTDFVETLERRDGADGGALSAAERMSAAASAAVEARAMPSRPTLEGLARLASNGADAERARELAVSATLALDSAARARGARLLVVYCPPAIEIDALSMVDGASAACEAIGRPALVQTVLARVGRRYVDEITTRGIPVFDVAWCVPPHPGRLTEPGTDTAGFALQEQIAAVIAWFALDG